MASLRIGQLARQAQVNVETVRYYERRGLLPKPPRRSSGYRQYAAEDLARLRFIKRAQGLGFTLQEIAELLALRVDPDTTCEDTKQQAEAKIADITAKLRALQRMRKVLVGLVEAFQRRAATSSCPILEALEARGGEAHADP
jgi:MerR family mercuric resistance operon transcriptional regulator